MRYFFLEKAALSFHFILQLNQILLVLLPQLSDTLLVIFVLLKQAKKLNLFPHGFAFQKLHFFRKFLQLGLNEI